MGSGAETILKRGAAAATMALLRCQTASTAQMLAVKTDEGEFIPGNRRDDILLRSDTENYLVKRQAQFHPSSWLSLGQPSTLLTASTR